MQLDQNYKEEDFDQMLFPVHRLGDGNALTVFPSLRQYKEFSANAKLPFSKVFKYIALCYDKGSPLLKIDSITTRKTTAAHMAGFIVNEEGRFEDEVNNMFQGRNIVINLMIIRYCRLMRSRSYMVLMAGNETLAQIIEDLFNYQSSDDKLKDSGDKIKLLTQAQDYATRMDKLSVEILSGDNNAHLADTLFVIIDIGEEEYIKLTPEDFANTWMINHPTLRARIQKGKEKSASPVKSEESDSKNSALKSEKLNENG